jgi:hypothetical protein
MIIPIANIEALMGIGTGFMLVVVVPLIVILTHHQRKMAELLHGRKDDDVVRRLDSMQAEIRDLRERLTVQVLRLDDHEQSLPRRTAPPEIPGDLRQRG